MDFESFGDNIVLFFQYNQYVTIVLLTGLVAVLLWKPRAVLKLLLFIGLFSLIFYVVFYFGTTFTNGIRIKENVVEKTERQLQKDRLVIPSRK